MIVAVVGYDANVDFFISHAMVPDDEATTYHPVTEQLYGITLYAFLPTAIRSGDASM